MIFYLALLFLLSGCLQQSVFYEDFETDLSRFEELSCSARGLCNTDSVSISEIVAREGNKSVRFVLLPEDKLPNDKQRSELSLKNTPLPLNEDIEISFSTYVPFDWVEKPDQKVIFQLHQNQDHQPINCGKSPILGLRIVGPDFILSQELEREDPGRILWTGPLSKGWNDWRILLRFNESGYIKIWHNNNLIVDYEGKTIASCTFKGPHINFGLYGDFVKGLKKREIFFDELKISTPGDFYGS